MEAATQCSRGALQEYQRFAEETRKTLQRLRSGSKQWWQKSRTLLQKRQAVSAIPLKDDDETWHHEAKEKADLFAQTFAKKFSLPDPVENVYAADEVHQLMSLLTYCGLCCKSSWLTAPLDLTSSQHAC